MYNLIPHKYTMLVVLLLLCSCATTYSQSVQSAHQIRFFNPGNDTGGVFIKAPTAPVRYTLTLPPGSGSNSQVLTTDGQGALQWSTPVGGWTLSGNANTDPATNFIGTTDNVDLVIRSFNTERMRIYANSVISTSGDLYSLGNLGSGAAPTERLTVSGNAYLNADDAGLVVDAAGSSRFRVIKKHGCAPVLAAGSASAITLGHWSTANILGNISNETFMPRFSISTSGLVTINSLSGTARSSVPAGYNRFLIADSIGQVEETSFSSVLSSLNGLIGTGTQNYVPKFTSSSNLGNSLLYDDGTNMGIGTAAPSQMFEIAEENLYLNSGSTAAELRFREPSASGSNYSALKAGVQAEDITYTLPLFAPATGQVLTSDAAGSLSWASISSAAWALIGIAGTTNGGTLGSAPTGNFLGTTGTAAGALSFVTNNVIQAQISTTGVLSTQNDMVVNGLAVGRGAGNVTSNTAIGSGALKVNTTGDSNIGLGLDALAQNTTGYRNTALGANALFNNVTGYENTAVGRNALLFNTGNGNTASGIDAMLSKTSGNSNSAIGLNALRSNTSGSNNVAMGVAAGRFIADGSTANQTGSDNVFIGSSTRSGGASAAIGATNEIVIGGSAIGLGSNSAILGNSNFTATRLQGNVGIGANPTTTAGDARLQVTAGAAANRDLVVKGAASNSANLLELQNNSGTTQFSVGPTGATSVGGTLTLPNVASAATADSVLLINSSNQVTKVTRNAFVSGSGWALTGNNLTDSASQYLGTANVFPLVMRTANSERMRISSSGNVGIGSNAPSQRLHVSGGNVLIDTGAASTAGQLHFMNPARTAQTNIRAGAQVTGVTHTLPTSAPTAGQVLSSDASGNMSWSTPSSTSALSSITAATAMNTIDNSGFAQTWNWSSLSSTPGITFASNSNNAVVNLQAVIDVALSGANATASQTTYGAQIFNTHTGTSSTNVGMSGTASNTVNNCALIVPSGNVGINMITPKSSLDVGGGVSIRPGAVSGTADNQAVTIGNRSFLRISSNSTPENRSITLSGGLQDGQILYMRVDGSGTAGNGVEIADSGNCNLSGLAQLIDSSVLPLVWDGNASTWFEVTRSLN